MTASTEDVDLPQPEPDDPSDVTVALEAARALWDNGETREALRWYARAAEAAEEAGDDMRALGLARAIAEIRDAIGSHSIIPPAPRASSPPEPERASAPPPPEAVKAEPVKAPSEPAPPANTSAAPPPAPDRASATQLTATREAQESAEPPARPSALPTKPPTTAPAAAPSPPANASATRTSGAAIRVAVKTSVRDPSLLIVRVLDAKVPLPAGTREAYLSPAVPGENLLASDT